MCGELAMDARNSDGSGCPWENVLGSWRVKTWDMGYPEALAQSKYSFLILVSVIGVTCIWHGFRSYTAAGGPTSWAIVQPRQTKRAVIRAFIFKEVA